MILKEEKDNDRKQKLLEEMEKLLTNLPIGLDAKNREAFNPKFSALKTFLLDMVI